MKHVLLVSLFSTILIGSAFSQEPVPSLSSRIQGTVWQEKKPGDGIRQSDEAPVAGILVKLLEPGTGKVVGTALSRNDGFYELYANEGTYIIEYVYPSEGFLPAAKRIGTNNQFNSAANPNRYTDKFTIEKGTTTNTFGLGLVPNANTVTYCTAKAPTVTVWNEDLMLPKSDLLAIPISVKLYLNESVWHPAIGIENLGTAEAYDIIASGQVSLSLPNDQPFSTSSSIPKKGTLPGFDGVKDFGGTSGISWFNEFAYASNTYDYPAFLIEGTFAGGGQISFPAESKSYVGITGSGNQQTLVQTYVSAGVCAVYTYEKGELPVKLVSFQARKEGKIANLTWKTTEEVNSERFEVERSNDGKQWERIGTVSAQGESSTLTSYSFTDEKPKAGGNLYRLKMIDNDQTYAYSRIVEVNFEGERTVYVYPNPVSNQLFVQSDSEDISSVQIFNNSGRLVKEVKSVSQPVDVRSLQSGIYAVRIHYGNGLIDHKSIVITQ